MPLIPSATIGMPTTAPANATTVSNTINTQGQSRGAVGLTSTVAGTLSVQRYVDGAGLVPLSTPASVAVVANTAISVGWSDGLPSSSIIISFVNPGGSPATLSNVTVDLLP